MKEAADYVLEALEADPKRLIRFKEVCDAIGMTTPNFRRSVRQHEDFEDVLAENGIVERPKDSVGQARYFGLVTTWFLEGAEDTEGGFSIEEYLEGDADLPVEDRREEAVEQSVEVSDDVSGLA